MDLRQRLSGIDQSTDDAPYILAAANDDPDSLANFDAVAAAPQVPLNYRGDEARSGQLLAILQSQASAIGSESPAAEQWKVDLWNAQQRWDHASRWLRLEMRVSAGLAFLRLDAIPLALNPDPIVRQVGEDQRAHLERLLIRNISTEGHLFSAVHTGGLSPAHESFVRDRVDELRAGLKLLSTELHRRIGTTRSRQALISRFKQRAEWHDAERLRAVADQRELGGHPEDRLTAELARFLFDQGLNPLTKPLVAGLEPDLLDPAVTPAFYVEAKQYVRSDRSGIVRALRQVLDTVGRLRSDTLPITEAFCVVFRRGGPRYLLPELFQAEGYRVFFTLVDIAPARVSGRRQQHPPSQITLEDLAE